MGAKRTGCRAAALAAGLLLAAALPRPAAQSGAPARSAAQSPAAGGGATSPVTVIRAGWVFDGSEVAADRIIVVAGGSIREIVPAAGYLPVEGARTIDASGQTVAPGFIDAHVHILSMPLPYLRDIPKRGWGRVAQQGVSLMPDNRKSFLAHGITAVVDMGAPVAEMARMERLLAAGKILGPDLYYCGPRFTAPGGHPAGTTYRGQHRLIDQATVQVDRREPALRRVAELQRQGVDFIKLVYDDGELYGGRVPRLDPQLAAAIAAEAHTRGLRVVAHAGAHAGGFREMIGCGVDGVEHCYPDGEAGGGSPELLREMAARGAVFTPTLSACELSAPQVLPRMQQSVRRAYEAGVTLAAGSGFPSTRSMSAGAGYYRELELLEQAGLPRLEVLKAATVNAARKVGREGEAGRIAAGRRANLLFLDGDARRDALSPDRVRRVMLGGRTFFESPSPQPVDLKGFARRSVIAFPYFFYDSLAGFSIGAGLLAFNLAGSGVAASADAAASFEGYLCGGLAVSPPSPIPATALALQVQFDGYPKTFSSPGGGSDPQEAAYESRILRAAVTGSTALAGAFRLNTSFSIDSRSIDPRPGPEAAAVPGEDEGLATLLRAELAHDTRDAPSAPWSGGVEAIAFGLSHPFIGSDWSFQTLDIDVRRYLAVARHHIIAGRLLYRQSFGEAPFFYQPDFGGSELGRGFLPDRFIGRVGLYGQLEYRFPIVSILGGVLFADAGQVAGTVRELAWDGFQLCGGAGLRLAFSESSILALDLGLNGAPLSRGGYFLAFRSSNAF